MQEQINQLNKQVQDLTKQVADLSAMLTNSGMSYNLKEIIRGEVIQDTDTITSTTEVLSISGTPVDITVAKAPTALLTLVAQGGRKYKVGYYE